MEKNRPAFHFAARLFTISALFFALPLLAFGWMLYQSDITSEKQIAHLHVQLDLERSIDDISEHIETERLHLAKIIHAVDLHSDASLKAKAHAGHDLFAFQKEGAYWKQIASSTSAPIGPLPHEYLERVAIGHSLSNMLGGKLAIAETEGETILIMTQSAPAFLKEAIKTKGRYPLTFSLKPLLQVSKDQIVYKKSIPGTSLYLTAALPKNVYATAVRSSFVYKVGWSALAVLILFAAVAYFFYRRLSHPFTRFVEAMGKLAKGDFSVRLPEDGKGLELHDLAHTFNGTLDQLEATIAEEKKSRLDKERLSRELEWAREIQKELLPPSIPTLTSLEIATHFSPALEVSGDFFDIFHSDGRLIALMADSSGKGLGPALFSLSLRGALRALLATKGEFAEKVQRANALFCADSKESGMFTTAAILEIDCTSFSVTYINAGHLPIALKSAQGTKLLEKNAPAFGLPWEKVEAKTVTLGTDSLIALFTDGLTEEIDPQGAELGTAPVFERLDASKSAEENCNALVDLHKNHRGEESKSDDLSLLVIRRP